jgi:aldehyde dehydrogenase (NAD+)
MAVPVTTTPTQDREHARVVDRLRTTFDTGRTRSPAWREVQLQGLHRMLVEREAELVAALGSDLRRSPVDALMLDLTSTKAEVRHALKHLRRWMRPRRVRAPVTALPGRAWYQYDPLGVVLVVGAWNYPIHLTLAPLVAGLAAGNCAVVKPSEIAPACSAVLAELLPRYVDPQAVAVVEGGADATLGLLGQGVDHCFFTGSAAVGSAVLAAAAPHLTPVTLELGGKCPVVVTASADVEVAARRIAHGKLLNSGQTCVAPDHVLVEHSVRDAFVEALVAATRAFSGEKRLPLVTSRHAARLAALLDGTGGHTALGGVVDVDAAEAEPTVLVDPDPDAAVMREEIFGPVLPVVGVQSLEHAITLIRRGGRPLASYLFSDDPAEADRLLSAVSTGAVVVNHVMLHLAVNDLPFGGVGTSGTGRYHGRWGFETFSSATAVLRKPSRPDPLFVYPPYGRLAEKIMRKVL